MKKALVTGAAGFIGSNLVRVLLNEGIEVRAMILPGEKQKNLEGLDIEKKDGDVLDPSSLDNALQGCDTLFHLAAIYSIWKKDRSVFYKVNLQGSRNMLWAAKRAGVEKVVYTSSIAGLGLNSGSALSDEETEFNLYGEANDYILTKYLSQEEALTFAREGLPLVVVNPCFPFGEGDVAPTPTGRMIIDTVNGLNPFYFKGGMNVVDVRDVAVGHLLAAEKGEVGEKYILGNQNFTVRQLFKLVGKKAGVRAAYIPMSVSLSKPIGYLMEKMAERSGRTPMTTSKEIPLMARYLFYDVSKAKDKLGLELTPIEESLERSIEWFRREGYIKK
jgi:dihydroflavonol-4-reductase